MNSNIEEVEEKLGQPVTCEDGKSHFIDESNKRYLSGEICQLFPKTEDNPDGYEPKGKKPPTNPVEGGKIK